MTSTTAPPERPPVWPRVIDRTLLHSILPALLVPDVRAAAEYYRDAFGFRICFVFDEDNPVFGIIDRAEGEGFHLARRDPLARPNRARVPGAWDAYVRVHDADREHAAMTRRGARVISPLTTRPWGMREFEVEDSWGYVLCFGSDVESPLPEGVLRIEPELLTLDLPRALRFYREQLGFDGENWGDAPGYAVLRRDQVVVHLRQAPTRFDPMPEPSPRIWNAFIETSGLDGLLDDLRQRGTTVARGPEVTEYEMREVDVRDPDGHVLCFGEPTNGVW